MTKKQQKENEETIVSLKPWGLEKWIKYTGITTQFVEKQVKYFYDFIMRELSTEFRCPTFSLEEYAYEQKKMTLKSFKELLVKLPQSQLNEASNNYVIVLYLNNIAFRSAWFTATFEQERAGRSQYQEYTMTSIVRELVRCTLIQNKLKADDEVISEKTTEIFKKLPVRVRVPP